MSAFLKTQQTKETKTLNGGCCREGMLPKYSTDSMYSVISRLFLKLCLVLCLL